jgi:hypothetical protein
MIISHKYKFIFIKTEKTAGTSIEIGLSKFCGREDIITPISNEDESTRKKLGYPPQNCFMPLSTYCLKDIRNLIFKGDRKLKYYNHMRAGEIKKLVGDDIWGSYYKFCFERKPWDKVISHYYWCHKEEPRPSISDFISSKKVRNLKNNGHGTYTIDGKIVVDRLCLFENLTEELELIRSRLGIPEPLDLPRAKSKYRKDKRSYKDILTDDEKEMISKIFNDEIQNLGYRY